MKLFKKNQIIIYVIVLMLMTAGYLNYTTKTEEQMAVETAMELEATDDMQLADIGDATLVNSDAVNLENTENTEELRNTNTSDTIANTTDTTNNTSPSNEAITETNGSAEDEYFVKSKLERDTMYSQMIETYEKVLNSNNTLETQRQSATEEIQKINNTKNSIMICENLIGTKGFAKCVVFVNGDSVSIIVGAEEIQQEEIAQIQNIIAREMKVEIENIHIATK